MNRNSIDTLLIHSCEDLFTKYGHSLYEALIELKEAKKINKIEYRSSFTSNENEYIIYGAGNAGKQIYHQLRNYYILVRKYKNEKV